MSPIVENPLTWLYLPTAIGLGALHALEPGHAKTLTAAYLIGIKGTKRDAFLLGMSVAITHSIVVISISVAALWLGRETFTQDVTYWLQIGSGIIVILLGAWLMIKRILHMRQVKKMIDGHAHAHAAPEPVPVKGNLVAGLLEITQTSEGERMRFTANTKTMGLKIRVLITRPNQLEILEMYKANETLFMSSVAPEEPHEFAAEIEITDENGKREVFPFAMHEPEDHHNDEHAHSLMDDDDHARAHAATIPEYAKQGERPTMFQIISFGAAGGMIPCPASITVMLLALSIGKFASGFLAVMGFSLGLAVTLVGIGLAVVAGLNKFQGSGRLQWVSTYAPVISAGIVMISGVAALLFVH